MADWKKRLIGKQFNSFLTKSAWSRLTNVNMLWTVYPLFIMLSIWNVTYADDCDTQFTSPEQGPKNGQFMAPEIFNPEKNSRHCLYTFVAMEGERVQIQFKRFSLRGTPPDGTTLGLTPACHHEYLDIYTEIRGPEDIDLLGTPFGGRYCGRIPPRLRVSLHRVAVIGFYTDYNFTSPEMFRGTYKFINGTKYEVGTSGADGTCGYIIHTDVRRNGVFMSPTYPGVYPKDTSCYWKFVGREGQRIRLEFRDFDLFFGGPHCPFDQVQIYDGPDQTAPLIGTYCGQQRHLLVFSTKSSLLVTFNTLRRTADTQNRGFQGIFNFSESYLSLDFINRAEAQHIRGTECDQKILSKGESNGTIFSPNYPFPYLPNVVCKYFIYGLQDAQNLERVKLQFFGQFDIPSSADGNSNCSDGYLRVYLRGQEVENKFDSPDYELCGKKLPPAMTAKGPRLLVVFNSGTKEGIKFKALYKFETEYKIPGTPAPNGKCTFTYESSSHKSGTFNSPRHPANYPSNTTCQYILRPLANEQVQIVFNQFKVRSDSSKFTSGNHCTEDYVEIYNIKYDRDSGEEFSKMNGRYCGEAIPGPIASDRDSTGLKVILRTDRRGVYSGFAADYLFETKKDMFADCGSNITHQQWGEITSPNWPLKYGTARDTGHFTCHWIINVRPQNKILLWFQYFEVEGNPLDRGCPAAVVRMWPKQDQMPNELCGGLSPEDSQIISEGNLLQFSFTTAAKAVGAKGFRAIWTELLTRQRCDGFLCHRNNFCIPLNLRCNRVQNCGLGDSSDEINCVKDSEVNVLMMVGVGVGISSVIFIVMCIWCHRKRVRRRNKNTLPHHVYERGARFASLDSVDRNLSPVLGTRKPMHHLSCSSLRTETVV